MSVFSVQARSGGGREEYMRENFRLSRVGAGDGNP